MTNNTIEQLLNHRSIRRFTDQAVSESVVAKIIAAGQAASTSSFAQSTSVIRVTDKQKRAQLADYAGGQAYVELAPEFLVFCADLWRANYVVNREQAIELESLAQFSWAEQLITSSVDVALFAQNCAVAAESLGLGICYIGGIRNEIAAVSDCLELPTLVVPLFGMCLGYPDQSPPLRPRLPSANVLFENTYGRFDAVFEEHLRRYDEQVKSYYEKRTNGKLSQTWTEQLTKQSQKQTRPHMLNFLHQKGFAKR